MLTGLVLTLVSMLFQRGKTPTLYLVKARFHWLLRRVAKTVRRRGNEATMSTKSITSTVSTTPRTANECWFETHDGTKLFYRHWPSEQGFSQQAIILLHRGHEHSGRLQHVVDDGARARYHRTGRRASSAERQRGSHRGRRGTQRIINAVHTHANDSHERRLVLVRPDQYVAAVLPLDAHDERADFLAGVLVEVR